MDEAVRYPLAGVRVVAVEQAVAVPLATRHMADLGAEVVKVERPPGGDFARHYDSLANGVSLYFAWCNRGKRSVVLDLKDEAGRAELWQLIKSADVFVHNLGPGVMERLGFGWEALSAANPRLIFCELAGFGADGPLAGRKAYDQLIQHESGAANVSGAPDAPVRLGISAVDISGGMYVLSSVLAALYGRAQDGQGKRLRINLFDTITEWLSVPLMQAKYGGSFTRAGRFHNSIFPYGPVRCADGEVVIAVQNQPEWERLCREVLRRPELVDDPRFATNGVRHQNRAVLDAIMVTALASVTRATLVARLEAADMAFAEDYPIEAAVHHPEIEARHRWMPVDTEFGTAEVLRSPFDSGFGWPTPAAGVPGLGGDGRRHTP